MNQEPGQAREHFRRFLERQEIVEPTVEEQRLAAELEAAAQRLALNLDAGESQLTAVLATRTIPLLVTGDKRAIMAIEQLIGVVAQLKAVGGHVQCLEQAVRQMIARVDVQIVRRAICAEPAVDKALTICFGCSNAEVPQAAIHVALDSYIDDLRASAPRVLSSR